MRFSKLAIIASFAVAILGTNANAQDLRQPTSVQNTSLNYSYYEQPEAQTSPSDIVPQGAMPDGACGYDNGCDDGCCDDGCCRSIWPCGCALADLGEANKLFDGCFAQCHNITAGGWLAQSYTWNPYRPVDRFNGPLTWTDRSNEYQMNELYGFMGRAAKTDGCGWDWGYRFDALYGTSYRWDTAAGLETNFGSNNAFYGVALPQFYGEVAYNDLTVKVGHFISPVGLYTVGTANNFFNTIPYMYQYGQPFTHTGFLATKKFGDKLTAGAGLVYGWDNFDKTGNRWGSYLGTATFTRDNGDTLAWVGVAGKEPNLTGLNGGFSTRFLQTLVYTHKFSDDVTGIVESDYAQQDSAVAGGGQARWYSLGGWLYWNLTCRCQWGLGGEWFRDEGGTRVGTLVPSLASPNARGLARGPGFDGSFYRATFGPKYYFTPNLYGRANFVFDAYVGKKAGANVPVLPFDDGTKYHQEVGVFDLVYTF